jgi:hypothetical protein
MILRTGTPTPFPISFALYLLDLFPLHLRDDPHGKRSGTARVTRGSPERQRETGKDVGIQR